MYLKPLQAKKYELLSNNPEELKWKVLKNILKKEVKRLYRF